MLTARGDPRNKYVRFFVGGGYTMPGGGWLSEGAWRYDHPLSFDGLFTIARIEKRRGRFAKKNALVIAETFKWFNEHIPCPPWSRWKEEGVWNKNWICWWRIGAREPIARLRPLMRVMRGHGLVICSIHADRLSNIKYRDKHQVVVEWEGER